ncbi:hypothetical protein AX14_008118 [Amanita brunnescens Koide BX004]|nr:hypothetical protein AX14_008118 [Amanita brunnescens Koide BX004]
MILGNLPPEIQSRILELCSPNDLAVLSRVHTSLQDVAEYALYSRIQYRARPFDLIITSGDVTNFDEDSWVPQEDRSLLHTFANNSRKASMVKMLYVELLTDEVTSEPQGVGYDYRARRKRIQFVLVKLADVLVKMPNLVDLRILHDLMEYSDSCKPGARRINEVIRFVFQRSGVNDSD